MNNEIKRNIIDEEHFTESGYPFRKKPNFSTLGSIIEISSYRPFIGFWLDDSIKNLLGFYETTLYKEYILSINPGDILTFDNIFLECDFAQGMTYGGKRSGIIQNFTMDVDPGYKYIDKILSGVQWYMMESKDFVSSINFKLKMKIVNWSHLMVKALLSDYRLKKFK